MRWTLPDGRDIPPEFGDVHQFADWLFVLAVPHVFRSMHRVPTREHILAMLALYVPYAQSDYAYFSKKYVQYQRRRELAVKLRELFEQWTPPELPPEITETARGLLEVEMGSEPEGGWDNVKLDGPEPIEDRLRWPESPPSCLLKENASGEVSPVEPLNLPPDNDNMDAIDATTWLMVLASPQIYRGLDRTPTREHLVHMLDLYIAYVGHDGRYFHPSFTPVPYERRAPLAAKLRAFLEVWTPPELPSEITAAARELLYAEGADLEWDNLTTRILDPKFLRWPEGIPALLKDEDEQQRKRGG